MNNSSKCPGHENTFLKPNEEGNLYCPLCRQTENMLLAVDLVHATKLGWPEVTETERQYARRLLLIYRHHWTGQPPLPGPPPKHFPLMLSPWLDLPERLETDLANAMGNSPYRNHTLRTWYFQDWELV